MGTPRDPSEDGQHVMFLKRDYCILAELTAGHDEGRYRALFLRNAPALAAIHDTTPEALALSKNL